MLNELLQNIDLLVPHIFEILGILFFVLVHFLSEPIRWTLYTQHSQLIQFNTLLKIFSLTALGTYILPFKLGIPLRIYLLHKKGKLNFEIIGALLVIDGLVNYFFWGVAGCLGFIYLFGDKLLTHILDYSAYLIIAIALALIFYLLRSVFFQKFRAVYEKIATVKSSLYFLSQISRPKIFMALVTIVLDISSHIFRHLFIFYVLDIQLALIVVASITTLSVMTGLLSMMPMGLIGYDASIILLLQSFGVSLEASLLVPVINRSSSFFISIVLGGWAGMSLGIKPISGLKKMATAIHKNRGG